TLGIGMSITVAPLTTAVMTSIDDERHAGAASGINNTVARAAALLAIALFGTIAVTIFAGQLDARLRDFPPAIRSAMAKQSARLRQAVASGAAAHVVRLDQRSVGAQRIHVLIWLAARLLREVAGQIARRASGERLRSAAVILKRVISLHGHIRRVERRRAMDR